MSGDGYVLDIPTDTATLLAVLETLTVGIDTCIADRTLDRPMRVSMKDVARALTFTQRLQASMRAAITAVADGE